MTPNARAAVRHLEMHWQQSASAPGAERGASSLQDPHSKKRQPVRGDATCD